MSRWEPSPQWLDRVFHEDVRPEVFGDARGEDDPVLVLLGGQPGAGKTRAALFAQSLTDRPLIPVIGDDLRSHHPDYRDLQRNAPEQMPGVTQAVSGPLVQRAIQYAAQHRHSVLVEGTFRDPQVALGTAADQRAAGFRVHAVAVAVPPAVSRAGTLARFAEAQESGAARWTPPAAHDAAVQGMPGTVEALGASEDVHRLSIISRSGELLFDSTTPGAQRGHQARAVIEHTYARALTESERELVAAQHGAAAEDRGAGPGADVQRVQRIMRATHPEGPQPGRPAQSPQARPGPLGRENPGPGIER